MKTLRMCDCTFIEIYDRILCIIQSPCVVITDSSFIHFFQQPDEAQQILHSLLYSTITPHTALLYHNLPDNNPTLIPSNSQIRPVSQSFSPVTVVTVEKCLMHHLKC